MAKTPKNHRKAWSADDDSALKLLGGETPTRLIGLKLGRTPEAVVAKARDLGISLLPLNRSPYGRGKR